MAVGDDGNGHILVGPKFGCIHFEPVIVYSNLEVAPPPDPAVLQAEIAKLKVAAAVGRLAAIVRGEFDWGYIEMHVDDGDPTLQTDLELVLPKLTANS
jgi:hypothetical protein